MIIQKTYPSSLWDPIFFGGKNKKKCYLTSSMTINAIIKNAMRLKLNVVDAVVVALQLMSMEFDEPVEELLGVVVAAHPNHEGHVCSFRPAGA